MKAGALGQGFLFRFMIAGLVAILVVSVMSMAVNFVVGTVSGHSTGSGDVTGKFIEAAPNVTSMYIATEIVVGIITFLGSFYVLSKKKK